MSLLTFWYGGQSGRKDIPQLLSMCRNFFSSQGGENFTLYIHPGELPIHHIDEPEMYNLYDKNRWIRYK